MYDDDDEYHTGGWMDFAADLVQAVAQAGSKQLKKPDEKATATPIPEKAAFEKAVAEAGAVVQKKKNEKTMEYLVWAVLGYIVYKELKRRR